MILLLGPIVGLALLALRREAGNGTRTRDPNLGKVVLYQLSYSRDSELNIKFASCKLPPSRTPSFPGRKSWAMEARGIEPLTS